MHTILPGVYDWYIYDLQQEQRTILELDIPISRVFNFPKIRDGKWDFPRERDGKRELYLYIYKSQISKMSKYRVYLICTCINNTVPFLQHTKSLVVGKTT